MIYTIPEIIEHNANLAPDKAAFRFDESDLSYADLWCKMNQLARTLVENGVTKGDRVGIYIHKSIKTPISIYGIMQAGAAFVPLDPLMPYDRLVSILNDCDIKHVISEKSKASFLTKAAAETPLTCVIGVDGIAPVATAIPWSTVFAGESQKVQSGAVSQDLAYIMYTSGSTGEPKGIMHTHASGLAYARISSDIYNLTPNDRLSNFPPIHFDQMTFDYFSGPLAGATTVIIPEEFMKFPASLTELIEDEKLTVWYSVPFALIQMLLHGAVEERDCSSLRWVIYGGEPFPPKHMHALQQLWPQVTFSNSYGPAETNQVNVYHLPAIEADQTDQIGIGVLWHDTHGLIVDDNDEPVAAGEEGELLIRTSTMMQGYWNRPELNAKAFFFKERKGGLVERYYRTGDYVKQLEDGNLMFLGRKDRQIKLRGYRIELDEIEAALVEHPAVAEAASYPVLRSSNEKIIEAAFVLKSGASAELTDLRKHLMGRVPKYAIPESILQLEDFPRTGSGKINRKELEKIRSAV